MNFNILKSKRFQFIIFAIFFTITAVLTYVFARDMFIFVYSVIRFTLIVLTALFILLSLLVLVGLRDQAVEIIKKIIDGSLTSIDLYEGIKKYFKIITKKLKNLLINLAPLYAFIICVYLYFFLIFIFKYVGSIFDVSIFTIFLTFILIMLTAFLTRPKKVKDFDKFKDNFIANFTDFFEVTLFIFFLTIDSNNLFFLPDSLNTELEAQVGNYDLMVRGINVYDNFNTTLNIILFIFIIEISRTALGFYIMAKKYMETLEKSDYTGEESILKLSVKQSLYRNIDDIIKFITYLTFVIFVFLFFPRLKLLAMAVASASALIADFIFTERLTTASEKKQDLIGKILARIFRL